MTARLVVADDEADIRRLVAFTLRRRGYTVLEASAGDTALALVRQEQPDLVVLDVMMPGLSGLEVAQELAADPQTAGIPILMLSARGQASEVDEGLRRGARAYLVKPFVPQELATQVASLLAARAASAAPSARPREGRAQDGPGNNGDQNGGASC